MFDNAAPSCLAPQHRFARRSLARRNRARRAISGQNRATSAGFPAYPLTARIVLAAAMAELSPDAVLMRAPTTAPSLNNQVIDAVADCERNAARCDTRPAGRRPDPDRGETLEHAAVPCCDRRACRRSPAIAGRRPRRPATPLWVRTAQLGAAPAPGNPCRRQYA